MDRGSAKHGPQLDEVMADEVRDYVRTRRETHAAEWRMPEPLTDDLSPAIDRQDGIGRGSAPPGMTLADVEERSELARWLGRAVFPADRDELADHLRHLNAPDHLVEELRQAPRHGSFGSVGELWRSLHGGSKEGSTHVESVRY
jgi:hypothetical protein